jgi:glycosyltransferase involved in cell wall biosynthesis
MVEIGKPYGSHESAGKVPIVMVLNSDFKRHSQGGVENFAKDLTATLREKGLDVRQAGTMLDGRNEEENEYGIAKGETSNYRFLFKLVRLAFRLRKQKRLIIHVQRPDHLVPFILLSKRKRMLVCTIHGPQRKAILENKGRIVSMVYNALENMGFRLADRIVFTDSNTMDWYLHLFPRLREKAVTIPPGVSAYFRSRIPRDEAISKLGFNKDDRIFCFVGRLEHEKNVELLIRTFSKVSTTHNNLRLAIAGDGSLREQLETLSKDLRMEDKVTFLGQLDREHVRDLLLSSDAMLLVSKWEGSPLVLREALAVGTPVICSDVGDACQLVRDESSGYIVREPTEESLAAGMEKAYARIGARVPEICSAEFSWDKIADRFIAIYGDSSGDRQPIGRMG